MIIAALFAAALAGAIDLVGLPLGELPPQVLPPQSCALFLWDRASRRRIVMAVANPATVSVIVDGKPLTFAATGAGEGDAVMQFAPRRRFGNDTIEISLDLAITASEGGGAVIRDGTVSFARRGGDTVVAPVAGLIGCVP